MVSSTSLDKPPALELSAERLRLAEAHEHTKPWYRWGPYLSERQYEYFHGDTGRGVGASHQTGWTGLVAKLLEQTGGR